jgi:hypothetical protein
MDIESILIGLLIVILIVCIFLLVYRLNSLGTKYARKDAEIEFRAQEIFVQGPLIAAQRENERRRHRDIIEDRGDNIEAPPMLIRWIIPRVVPRGTPFVLPPPGRTPKSRKKPKISTGDGSRNEKAKQYYEELEDHDNDSQNVHNPAVLHSLSRKYRRLLELSSSQENEDLNALQGAGISEVELRLAKIEATLQQMRQRIRSYYIQRSESKKCTSAQADMNIKKIEMFLKEVERGGTITSISPIALANERNDTDAFLRPDGTRLRATRDPEPIREDWILSLVWERIHSPDNKEHEEELETALMDQMIDGVKKNSPLLDGVLQLLNLRNTPASEEDDIEKTHAPVCINGRVGRMISSLTILDADPILTEPEKDEKEIANVAYYNANNILQKSLQTWEIKDPGIGKSMLEIYNSMEQTDREKEIVEEFAKSVKGEIEKELREKYTGTIGNEQLNDIIAKAQSGIEVS